jgi:hypothetical protein
MKNYSELKYSFMGFIYLGAVIAYEPEVPGSIPGATRFSE